MGIRVSYHRISSERLELLRTSLAAMRDFVYGEAEGETSHAVEIHKAWDGLHYLLDPARRAMSRDHPQTPRGRMILGGEVVSAAFTAVDEREVRSLSNAEVKAAASDLSNITQESLRSAMDWPAMVHQIYGALAGEIYDARKGGFTLYTEDEHFERYWSRFTALRDFYRDVAASDDCVIVLKD